MCIHPTIPLQLQLHCTFITTLLQPWLARTSTCFRDHHRRRPRRAFFFHGLAFRPSERWRRRRECDDARRFARINAEQNASTCDNFTGSSQRHTRRCIAIALVRICIIGTKSIEGEFAKGFVVKFPGSKFILAKYNPMGIAKYKTTLWLGWSGMFAVKFATVVHGIDCKRRRKESKCSTLPILCYNNTAR